STAGMSRGNPITDPTYPTRLFLTRLIKSTQTEEGGRVSQANQDPAVSNAGLLRKLKRGGVCLSSGRRGWRRCGRRRRHRNKKKKKWVRLRPSPEISGWKSEKDVRLSSFKGIEQTPDP